MVGSTDGNRLTTAAADSGLAALRIGNLGTSSGLAPIQPDALSGGDVAQLVTLVVANVV